jgi:hypothetical protein
MPDNKYGQKIKDPRLSRQLRQHIADDAWALTQDHLVERYGGQVILLHRREVLGSGRNHLEALESARTALQEAGRAMPPSDEWLFVIVPTREALDGCAEAVARRINQRE